MFISYIIPIYNGAEFLPRCLDSILCQQIPKSEYEVICVDDCSTDNSRELVKQYTAKHANVRLVSHSKNSRVATACNTGVDNARGDYFWIIGQDDWIAPDSIVKLHKAIHNIDAAPVTDLVLFNYQRSDDHGNAIENNKVFEDIATIKGRELVNEKFGDNYVYYLLGFEWRAIFRRAYIKSIDLRFPDGQNFEDSTYLFKAIMLSPTIATIQDTLYFYRVNPQSIMSNLEVTKRGNLVYEFAFVCGEEVETVAQELMSIDEHIAEILKKKAIWYYNTFAIDIIRTSKTEKDNFYSVVKERRDVINAKKHYLKLSSRLLLLPYAGRHIADLFSILYRIMKSLQK